MPSNKKYTSINFTKRVDHIGGLANDKRISEPAICAECEAVYTKGRWTFDKDLLTDDLVNKIGQETTTVCPACLKIKDGIPSGIVNIKGSFFNNHQKEIENLLKNEEEKIAFTNPLARIMDIERAKNGLTVTTTTENLAQHFGRALKKAYGGDVHYDFSHENKLARVYWEREE
jgi:NMD protein affecting ribosome stability and mRNA decay